MIQNSRNGLPSAIRSLKQTGCGTLRHQGSSTTSWRLSRTTLPQPQQTPWRPKTVKCSVAPMEVMKPSSTSTGSAPARAPSAIRHRRRQLLLTSVAAAIALVVGLSVFSDDDTAPTFIAEATNNELPEAYDGAATATVSVDDSPTLVLAFSDELPTEDPVELWLIKPDLSEMVSLGLVEPGDTEWDWPTGIDPNEYSLVDLSIEPDNGDPTHSGRSILRGELKST
jgi:anti-sigma-K factor RskA